MQNVPNDMFGKFSGMQTASPEFSVEAQQICIYSEFILYINKLFVIIRAFSGSHFREEKALVNCKYVHIEVHSKMSEYMK